MVVKRIAQIICLASLALAVVACGAIYRVIPTPTPGYVARLVPDGQDELLRVGDKIYIGDKGPGILNFADFLRVEAFSKTRLQVKELPDPDGPRTVKLHLDSGTTFQELQGQVDRQVTVITETDWATIRAAATVYMVSVDDNEVTWVVVFYGEVEVEAQERTVVVRTGQATIVEPGKAPRPPIDAEMGAVDDWVNATRHGEDVGSIKPVIFPSVATPTPTTTSIPTATPTPKPAGVRLISELQISNLSPLVGERVKATFRVKNYGEQPFKAAKFLVKGRGPDGSIQDFRPRDDFSLDPGAEDTYSEYRSFSAPGRYWFTPHYSPDGANWDDITWPDGRTSYVYVNVVPDYPPRVQISVEPSTIYKGADFVIKVTASDDTGLQSIRWWSEGTGDESLDQGGEFVYDGGIGSFDKSWSRTWTGNKGKFAIYAQARDTAGQLSSVVSTVITALPTEKFSLSIGGEPFNDTSVQVALGLAINWAALREEIGEVVLVDFSSGETLAGPTKPAYDPDLAKRLLAEAGYDGFDTVLLYDSGDEAATELAEEVARYLDGVGINTERRGFAQANARTQFATMLAAGESGLLIERR
jgi:hypothetical protein